VTTSVDMQESMNPVTELRSLMCGLVSHYFLNNNHNLTYLYKFAYILKTEFDQPYAYDPLGENPRHLTGSFLWNWRPDSLFEI